MPEKFQSLETRGHKTSNAWKHLLLFTFTLAAFGTCVLASPGGQRGFFQAWYGATKIGWQPTEITNMVVWLDANYSGSLTLSNSDVLAWGDLTDGGYDFVVNPSDSRPPALVSATYGKGNAIRFQEDSTTLGDHLINTNISLTQPGTIAFTAVWDGSGAARNYVYDGESPSANSPINRWLFSFKGSSDLGTSPSIFAGNWLANALVPLSSNVGFVVVSRYDSTSSKISINGEESTGNAGANNLPYGIILGGNYQNPADDPLNGWIYSFYVFDGTITEDEKEKLEGYMAWRHGFQSRLRADHPYKNFAP